MNYSLESFAEALHQARCHARPLPKEAVPTLSLDQGYAVQDRLVRLAMAEGSALAGWKVGLTSAAALAAFGASEPMIGSIFDDKILDDGAALDPDLTCAPRIEGEVLIEIRSPPDSDASDDVLLASIGSVRAAIEIADSRIFGWPHSVAPAAADDACCGWLVISSEPVRADSLDLAAIEMKLFADGVAVAAGQGSDCLGSPLAVYRWFLAQAALRGWEVSPGDFLLTGAMGAATPMRAGTQYRTSHSGLGALSMRFGQAA